jgi:hypothetical protein
MTYTAGFTLKFEKNITKSDYVQLCIKISNKLNTHYGFTDDDKICIIPEKITEGGLKFIGGKNNNYGLMCGKYGKMYKSMRTSFYDTGIRRWITWQYLDTNDIYKYWENNNEILIPKKSIGTTFLKANNVMCVWTVEELKIFEDCFNEYGIKCGYIPPSEKLLRIF